jgi:hypothetical protein
VLHYRWHPENPTSSRGYVGASSRITVTNFRYSGMLVYPGFTEFLSFASINTAAASRPLLWPI